MKIPGYIKDDFNFYISRNDLVVTTEKRKGTPINQITNMVSKHSYCYPSAYFKRTFQLPLDIVRDEIIVDYKDEILHFHLYKSKKTN